MVEGLFIVDKVSFIGLWDGVWQLVELVWTGNGGTGCTVGAWRLSCECPKAIRSRRDCNVGWLLSGITSKGGSQHRRSRGAGVGVTGLQAPLGLQETRLNCFSFGLFEVDMLNRVDTRTSSSTVLLNLIPRRDAAKGRSEFLSA